LYSELQSFSKADARERTSRSGRKQWGFRTSRILSQPALQILGGIRPQWNRALLATLAVNTHPRRGCEREIADPHTDQLGDAGARVVKRRKHHAVALTSPRTGIWRGKNGFDLLSGKESDHRLFKALHGNRQYGLGERESGRLLEGDILHERANGRKPCVAATNAVMPLLFKVFEEIKDESRVEIVDGNVARSLVQLVMSEGEQKPKAVAIGRYRSWADVLLLHQALSKELLQKHWKRLWR